MGKITGFIEFERVAESYEAPGARLKHYKEFVLALEDKQAQVQGARCMDCGIPFCNTGCPVNNIIPDWNDLVYRQEWKQALDVLHSTNNFPEFTGRICPAPCEEACTLNISNEPVGIKSIEHAIIDKGWEQGWVVPQPPLKKSGKKVAVVGSGPAGLAAAQQLARAGHSVTVFEKSNRIGGLLRYGIPDFKLDKSLIERRVSQMEAEGVEFLASTYVGAAADATEDGLNVITTAELDEQFDAVIMAGGSEAPRDLPVPGRELGGVHFAMDFLRQQNKRNAGDRIANQISAAGKHVIVIGGGDTGSDCVGTSNRQGAASVTQIELMPRPPEHENKALTWPYWPAKLRTSSSHVEGCERDWAITTKSFQGDKGKLKKLVCARVEWVKDDTTGQMKMQEVEGSEFELKADLVFLAMGFVSPVAAVLDAFGVEKDQRGNVKANVDNYRTSRDKVFSAGDMRRGQSLVVWAIREGRQCARAVDEFLMGASLLPR
ncbi:glutamate synthase subunit beta [Advenella mimigardefordensis]|uniref:NADPH-dependent glutamate synthase n=1 Tax=Advenella mimigardefordensis (strain DSM 17166 / LMG 22922 / DPN7) TaxID=1247726 RepID=W0P747_ADVMD|nr:glutamate synthase subunit beta [Advenella mimigardefordensis]AHG62576.1 NADPH-dependent glutamate synthase [Advenella mimigardefordensis DPN7]